jgi:hypothetical protein
MIEHAQQTRMATDRRKANLGPKFAGGERRCRADRRCHETENDVVYNDFLSWLLNRKSHPAG